jgi:4-hydroxy-2-oxoheptanedioate aldolase
MNLKEKLKKGQSVIGTWCILPSPQLVNVLAKAGLDFILIDMEHAPTGFETAQLMIEAAESEGCEAIIRVPNNDEIGVLRALDIGASGVIVPHIESVIDRENAMSYIKYPPVGIRGFSPYTKTGHYHSRPEHTKIENDKTLSGIIVEGMSGIKDYEKIIDDPALDLVYLGAYDLSVALGIPGDVNNPKIKEMQKFCTEKAREKNKAAGGIFHSETDLAYFKKIGVQFLCYKVDTSIIYDEISSMLNFAKK